MLYHIANDLTDYNSLCESTRQDMARVVFHKSYLSAASVATSRLKRVKLSIDDPWTKHLFSPLVSGLHREANSLYLHVGVFSLAYLLIQKVMRQSECLFYSQSITNAHTFKCLFFI